MSASLQDLVQRHLRTDGDLHFLPMRAAIQLNDTHPSIAIPELMRLLVDIHGLPWNDAWLITVSTFSYTNHTLLPEALESWPMDLFERVLPRHLQIIYRINAEHIEGARSQDPVDFSERIASISLIDEQNGRKLRMGHLAFVGSHRVNGVSALHTELMRKTVFRDLHALYPDRIVNKTNGITFRRWLMQANPALVQVLREACGDAVLDDPSLIARLAEGADDSALRERVAAAKRANKVAFSRLVGDRMGLRLDPDALFDVQIKRIHEYKRQLLNILETVAIYRAMRDDPTRDWVPRVKIFAGKAAASYTRAKLIIKLINDVAKVVNEDPVDARSFAGRVPARLQREPGRGDHSRRRPVGADLDRGDGGVRHRQHEARPQRRADDRHPRRREYRDSRPRRRRQYLHLRPRSARGRGAAPPRPWRNRARGVADALRASSMRIEAAIYWPGEGGWFAPLLNGLRHDDHYMVAADFDAYFATQRRIDGLWRSPSDWTRMCIMNIANMAWFSSDRAIGEYAQDVWRVPFTMPADAGR